MWRDGTPLDDDVHRDLLWKLWMGGQIDVLVGLCGKLEINVFTTAMHCWLIARRADIIVRYLKYIIL